MPTRNQSPSQLVVIEGPNGAGKSHVARHLGNVMAATIIRYPEPFLDFRARSRLDDAIPPLPRLVYYLAGAAHLSEEIAATPGPIVCDRYFASPLAQMLAEGTLSADVVFDVSMPVIKRLVIPVVTVLLTAEPDALRERLEIRSENRQGSSMRLTRGSSTFATEWTDQLKRIISAHGRLIEVDTTHLDPAAVCKIAQDAVADAVADE